ncbi:MAG: sortase [Candidatus Onthomonas sp.]
MRNKKGVLFICCGLLLIAAALSLTVYNLYDSFRAGDSARQAMHQLENLMPSKEKSEREETNSSKNPDLLVETEIPDYVLHPDMEMPVERIDGVDYIGILRIPALELELPVISQWSYPSLKMAPCRYSGSAYQNNLVIAAHNYTSHFGKLKNLSEGDMITFTDIDGNVFTYTVTECEILNPTDVEKMKSGDWDLTLFTCTIGGKTRVTIRCAQELG